MRLRHLALPGLTRYAHAQKIQESIVAAFLAYKAQPSLSPPDPTIITAQFHPVYTCGRRERYSISVEQENHLRANGQADFHVALRGGQTTYHGPGQLTSYVICDLRRHNLGAKCYVDALEGAVIDTVNRFGVSEARRTENPGVWTHGGEKKICAVGVHLRRHVSSHGIGLNVDRQPIDWLGRIVACGLPGKGASCVQDWQSSADFQEVERDFVKQMAARLSCDVIEQVHEQDAVAT